MKPNPHLNHTYEPLKLKSSCTRSCYKGFIRLKYVCLLRKMLNQIQMLNQLKKCLSYNENDIYFN